MLASTTAPMMPAIPQIIDYGSIMLIRVAVVAALPTIGVVLWLLAKLLRRVGRHFW
ncbi:MAG: hypothetical protein AAFX79_13600 [Planctomycetota bacterium]